MPGKRIGSALLSWGLVFCLWAGAALAQAPGKNLALGKPAQQSSISPQWSKPADPQGAVDGVKEGSFGFHTRHEVDPWWEVDLIDVCRITDIWIYNREDGCQERARTLSILLSEDGQNWREVYRHDGTIFGGVAKGPLKVRLEGARGRYVRLQLNEANEFHLDEVEIYGTPLSLRPPTPSGAGITNLALNQPAQQSSRSEWSTAKDPQGAVDGVKNGLFGFHTKHEANPWWEVDLGKVCTLSEIRVYNREDCCSERTRTLQILLSENGRIWHEVYTLEGRTFGGIKAGPLRVPLDGARARYVRLRLNESSWLHLDEVEVWGRQ